MSINKQYTNPINHNIKLGIINLIEIDHSNKSTMPKAIKNKVIRIPLVMKNTFIPVYLGS